MDRTAVVAIMAAIIYAARENNPQGRGDDVLYSEAIETASDLYDSALEDAKDAAR